MSKVFISFLGTGTYKECVYLNPQPDGNPEDSGVVTYVQTATRKMLAPDADRTLIFCTQEAAVKHWTAFTNEFAKHKLSPPDKIGIPSGGTTDELWEIFQTVCDCVDENDEIVFDVTHSFRSLPLIMSVVLNYLETVKNTILIGCYYGAFEKLGPSFDIEKKYPNPMDRKVPVFDLTGFLKLNKWTQGIRDFTKFGRTEILGKLAYQQLTPFLRDLIAREGSARDLRCVVEQLEKFSTAVLLCRAGSQDGLYNMRLANNISRKLENPERLQLIPPFTPLLAKIRGAFDGYEDNCALNGIRAARWAFDRGLIPQACTLLQETVITKYVERYDNELQQIVPTLKPRDKRDYISGILSWDSQKGDINEKWKKPNPEIAASIWCDIGPVVLAKTSSLAQYRNSINHAATAGGGQRDLAERIGEFVRFFESLFLKKPEDSDNTGKP